MQVSSVWVFDWSRTVCCDKFTPEIVRSLILPIWQLISKNLQKRTLEHFVRIHAVMELTTPEPQTLWAGIRMDKNNESDQVKKTKMSISEMRDIRAPNQGITETTATKQKMEEQRIFQTFQWLAIVSHEAIHLEAGPEEASSLCPCKKPPFSNLAKGTLLSVTICTRQRNHSTSAERKKIQIWSNLH